MAFRPEHLDFRFTPGTEGAHVHRLRVEFFCLHLNVIVERLKTNNWVRQCCFFYIHLVKVSLGQAAFSEKKRERNSTPFLTVINSHTHPHSGEMYIYVLFESKLFCIQAQLCHPAGAP